MKVVWKNKIGDEYVSITVRDPEEAREVIIKEMKGIAGELSTFGEIGDTITIEPSEG